MRSLLALATCRLLVEEDCGVVTGVGGKDKARESDCGGELSREWERESGVDGAVRTDVNEAGVLRPESAEGALGEGIDR